MKSKLLIAYLAGLVTMLLIGAASDPEMREIASSLKRIAYSVEKLAGEHGR